MGHIITTKRPLLSFFSFCYSVSEIQLFRNLNCRLSVFLGLTHYHTMPHFDALQICNCGKHREKRRNCLLQAISSFLTMFSTQNQIYFSFSVGSVQDLRTGDRWFDPQPGQYSFRGLMIVIATGLIPLSPLSVVSTMNMWESSQRLGKNTVLVKKNSRKAWIGALAAAL